MATTETKQTVKLMQQVEHWRENGAVQNVIDRAEAAADCVAADYARYDDLIDEFSTRVAQALEDAGHEVVWVTRQSRGVGCVVQGGEPQDAAFLAAVDECAAEFFADLVRFLSLGS